jgi:hypothetical protein
MSATRATCATCGNVTILDASSYSLIGSGWRLIAAGGGGPTRSNVEWCCPKCWTPAKRESVAKVRAARAVDPVG